jgi:hypothetical protein
VTGSVAVLRVWLRVRRWVWLRVWLGPGFMDRAGAVAAVAAAGGADPGVAAVGVLVDLPAAFVLEAVVVPAQALQVVGGGAAAGGEGDAVVEVGELGGPVAAGEPAGAIPQPDIPVQRRRRRVPVRITDRWVVDDPNVQA